MNCRFGPKHPESPLLELTPGLNRIVCEVQAHEAGDFSSQLHLFVDDQGTREIVFTVRGTAKPAP